MLTPTIAINNSRARRGHRRVGTAHLTSLIRATLALVVLTCHGPVGADVLADWSRLAYAETVSHGADGTFALDRLLTVQLAMLEARDFVLAPCMVRVVVSHVHPLDVDADAAIAAAAHVVLVRQFPMDRPRLDKVLSDTLAQVESRSRRNNGAIIGAAIGDIVAAVSPQVHWRSAVAAAGGTCALGGAEQRAQLIEEDDHAR
jgi:hypothetical protein